MKVNICVSRDEMNPTEWIAELGPISEEMCKKHGNPLYIGSGSTSVKAAADAIEWAWKNKHEIDKIVRYSQIKKN